MSRAVTVFREYSRFFSSCLRRSVASLRIRLLSCSRSSTASWSSFPASTSCDGSMYTVAPLSDLSCTIPLTEFFLDAATGMTNLPALTVGGASLTTPVPAKPAQMDESLDESEERRLSILFVNFRRAGEADGESSPSGVVIPSSFRERCVKSGRVEMVSCRTPGRSSLTFRTLPANSAVSPRNEPAPLSSEGSRAMAPAFNSSAASDAVSTLDRTGSMDAWSSAAP